MKALLCCCFISGALIAEPACPLCEMHRAYNKEHPGEYEFYEDYLEAEKKKKEDSSIYPNNFKKSSPKINGVNE